MILLIPLSLVLLFHHEPETFILNPTREGAHSLSTLALVGMPILIASQDQLYSRVVGWFAFISVVSKINLI